MAMRDIPRVEIAQYVVEGTRSISAAISAVERAQHLNTEAYRQACTEID